MAVTARAVAVAMAAEVVASTAEVVAPVIVAVEIEVRTDGRTPDDGETAQHLSCLLLALRARNELKDVRHRHALVEAVVTAGAKVFVKGQAKTP